MTKRKPDVLAVGLVEIAERLGVERTTAVKWNQRGLLPEPAWTVSGAPAWDWAEIEAWAKSTGRLS
jgi:predicted DNA-binding transcriptional regulator AlpA